jgi:hypothetical protein
VAKAKKNVVIQGLRGKIGGLVFREMPDGSTRVSGTPNFSKRKFSEAQIAQQNRIREASAYAKDASRREPIYAEIADGTVYSAYNIALSDWFRSPVIHEVVRKDGLVQILASDNVKVASVQVLVLDDGGNMSEKKEARQVNEKWWECACDAKRIRVEARDLARNLAAWEG